MRAPLLFRRSFRNGILVFAAGLVVAGCKKAPQDDSEGKGLQHVVSRWMPLCQPANAGTGGAEGEETRKKSWWRAGVELGLSLSFHCLEESFVRDGLMHALDFGQSFSDDVLSPHQGLLQGKGNTPSTPNVFVPLKCTHWFDDSFDGTLAFANPFASTLRQKRYCMKVDSQGGCSSEKMRWNPFSGGENPVCKPWPVVRFVAKQHFQVVGALNMRTSCSAWLDPTTTPPPSMPFLKPASDARVRMLAVEGMDAAGRAQVDETLLFFTAYRLCEYATGVNGNIFQSRALATTLVPEFAQLPGPALKQRKEHARAEKLPQELTIPKGLALHRGVYEGGPAQASLVGWRKAAGEVGASFASLVGIPVERWFVQSDFSDIPSTWHLGNSALTVQCSKWYDDFFDGSFDFLVEMKNPQGKLRQKRFCTTDQDGLKVFGAWGVTFDTIVTGFRALLKKPATAWPVFRFLGHKSHAALGSFEADVRCERWAQESASFVSAGKAYAYTAKRKCTHAMPQHWVQGPAPNPWAVNGQAVTGPAWESALIRHNGARFDSASLTYADPKITFEVEEFAALPRQ